METTTDQLPPHDSKAEGLLLACAIHRPAILLALSDELFYLNESKEVFKRMIKFKEEKKTSLDVPEHFEHDLMLSLPKDVFAKLNASLNELPSPAGWSYWLEIVSEHAQARKLMAMNLDLHSAAASLIKGDKSGMQSISKKLQDVSGIGAFATDFTANVVQLDDQAGNHIEQMWDRGDSLVGISTGFNNLNRFTSGLQTQKFYVVGGRPGKGKSAFLAQLAHRAASENFPTLFMSLEMPAREVYERIISIMSRVDLHKFKHHTATPDDFKNVTAARVSLRKIPLTILDKALTLPQILAATENAIQHGTKLIVVDYIQKVNVPNINENRSTVIGYITNALKEITMKHEVTVLAAGQLNRDSEKEEREPMLSDFRESGSIENDADWVGLLHEKDAETTDLIIGKNRSGPEGKIAYRFRKEIFRFDEK